MWSTKWLCRNPFDSTIRVLVKGKVLNQTEQGHLHEVALLDFARLAIWIFA